MKWLNLYNVIFQQFLLFRLPLLITPGAWAMLRDLDERGEISWERGLVEPTSGNTGISLAAIGARPRLSVAGRGATAVESATQV
jgi:hypothetical protein